MADSNGGASRFGGRFKQTAGQVRKEIEFKNALMRHLAEKCASVENESSNSEDELTAKEGLQIEASRDELVAQLEADEETKKFRERQALSHAVHSQHMELLLRRGLEEVRQKRKEAERQAEPSEAANSGQSEAASSGQSEAANSGQREAANSDEPSKVPIEAADKVSANHESPSDPANSDEACPRPIAESSSGDDVTSASRHSRRFGSRTALSGDRRAASVEEGNVERVGRIKLAQTRNNSFGQTPNPPNSAPANKTQRFDYV